MHWDLVSGRTGCGGRIPRTVQVVGVAVSVQGRLAQRAVRHDLDDAVTSSLEMDASSRRPTGLVSRETWSVRGKDTR